MTDIQKTLAELSTDKLSYDVLPKGFKQCTKCNGCGLSVNRERDTRLYLFYHERCSICVGNGFVESATPDVEMCDRCHGGGIVKGYNGVINCPHCKGEGYICNEYTVKPLTNDEYAIKILQWLHDNGQDFSSDAEFNAKEYLEEIKSDLTTVKFMNYGVWFDSDQNTDKSLKQWDKLSTLSYAKWCDDNNIKHPNCRRN